MNRFLDGDVIRYANSSHCIDGTAIVSKSSYGGNYLVHDTFWDTDRTRVHHKPEDCELLFNLNNVRQVKPHEYELYSEYDAYCLSTHHGHRKLYYVRKGASPSLHHQFKVAKEKLAYAEAEVESAYRRVRKELEDVVRLKCQLESQAKEDIDLTTANADMFNYKCKIKDGERKEKL